METWLKSAKRIKTLEAETCFLLHDDLYYGADRYPELSEGKLVESLSPPAISRQVPSIIRTSEAIDNVDELGRYYADIICLARKHQLPFNRIRQYFWLCFWLWNTEEDVQIGFPWYDTQAEIDRFIDAITSKKDGKIFWDSDQGWELEVYAANDDLFMRLGNFDDEETYVAVILTADPFVERLLTLQVRTRSIIDLLSPMVGRDLWTKYVDWQTFLEDGSPN